VRHSGRHRALPAFASRRQTDHSTQRSSPTSPARTASTTARHGGAWWYWCAGMKTTGRERSRSSSATASGQVRQSGFSQKMGTPRAMAVRMSAAWASGGAQMSTQSGDSAAQSSAAVA
jgi:hypothetical protein